MDTFIFNNFKNLLLNGGVKGVDTWYFVGVNSNFTSINQNILKSVTTMSDINSLIYSTYINQKDELKTTTIFDHGEFNSDWLASAYPIYYNYKHSTLTESSDKPMFVSDENFEEFLEQYPANKHLKDLFFLLPDGTPNKGRFFRYADYSDKEENFANKPRGFYFVRTTEELKWCADTVNGNQYGEQYNNYINIVLGDNIGPRDIIVKNKINNLKHLDFCIGNKPNRPYEGIFYGNGYKIQNIEIQGKNNSNGLIGYLGLEGIIDSIRLTGIVVLRNYKKLSITHMMNDGCDINAGVLCGTNCGGHITNISVNSKVFFNGFSPKVYAVSNRTDNDDESAYKHPNENIYYPSYLCINSKANIIPYIGYFAEGVHSSVAVNAGGYNYWNTTSAYQFSSYKPFDDSTLTEWAYPGKWEEHVPYDITAHTLYYDIRTMQETQSLVTNNESDWNSYLSMLPDVRKTTGETTGEFNWGVTSARYSDKSIKMHQFNRVAYYTGIIAGNNQGYLSNININAKTVCAGTFVGFLGGLAGKQTPNPHFWGSCCNCCVNVTATDDGTRNYFDTVESKSVYKPIESDNTISIFTYNLCESYVNFGLWINKNDSTDKYAYSDSFPIIQLGLEGKNTKKFIINSLGYCNVTSSEASKIKKDINALIELSKSSDLVDSGSKSKIESSSIIPEKSYKTISCNIAINNDPNLGDIGLKKFLPADGLCIAHFDNIDQSDDGIIELKDVKFNIQSVDGTLSKLKPSYGVDQKYDTSTVLLKTHPIKWVGGVIKTLKIKFNKENVYYTDNKRNGYIFNNYNIIGANGIVLYGYKNPLPLAMIGNTVVEVFNVELKDIDFNNTIKNHLTLGYIGYGETYANRQNENSEINEYICNRFMMGKQLTGCENYYIQEKSIKNIGALFGSYVVRKNSIIKDVSAYLDNQISYSFNSGPNAPVKTIGWENKPYEYFETTNTTGFWSETEQKKWKDKTKDCSFELYADGSFKPFYANGIYISEDRRELVVTNGKLYSKADPTSFPYKLKDYAFNNRFSSLAAICEVNTDCIGDFTEGKILDLKTNQLPAKPLVFDNVHLHYNEASDFLDSKGLWTCGPMLLSRYFNNNNAALPGSNSSFTCPFGVANPFFAEIKCNYLAIPTIIESSFSNMHKFDIDSSNILNKDLYERIGLFTMDQNLASPTNNPTFWTVNKLVDLPGDTKDKTPIWSENTDDILQKMCDGLNSITIGSNKYSFSKNSANPSYGLYNGLWSVVPSGWHKTENELNQLNEWFDGNKQGAYDMYFGSDIMLIRHPITEGPHHPLDGPYIIDEHHNNDYACGEFRNNFKRITGNISVKTENNTPFSGFSGVEYDPDLKENIALADDPKTTEIFKYTYDITSGSKNVSLFNIDVELTDNNTNGKFGFRFMDEINDGNYYDDSIVYDGSVLHLGMNVNEDCILNNLQNQDQFSVSSILAPDLDGFMVFDKLYRPIMFIDLEDYDFNGNVSWALNCTVNNNNTTSAYKDKEKPKRNYGMIMEID